MIQPTPRTASQLAAVSIDRQICWLMMLVLLVGCSGESSKNAQVTPPANPLRAMKSAVRNGQWAEAWQYHEAVLSEHADDADVLAMVAKVAHANNEGSLAADLLADACRAEDFAQAARVQQTMIAMISIGRFYDGIEVLEEAITKQPAQHETRRWLYDFYMGSENRAAGLPHGRYLVRQRKFDLELLNSLSNTERRSMDAKPLEEMAARNPNDKRPLLGRAKIKFDDLDFDEAAKMLRSIVEAHPDYLPAQVLLGRALAASGQYEDLETWVANQTDQIESLPGYWLAIGDWARSRQQFSEAARAYWEAARRDPDVMESWSKLSAALKQLNQTPADLPPAAIDNIDDRTALLSKFNQLKNRFERTGGISRETAVQIVDTLRELGRLWEAEAWAAMALTLPEDDSVSVEQTRNDIVAMLRQRPDAPWQLIEQHPELQLDLSSLAGPSIGSLASSARDTRRLHRPRSETPAN